MENPERVFTRDQLLRLCRGMDYVGETRTVDVHVGTLRMKLGECGDYIETVRVLGTEWRRDNDKTYFRSICLDLH